jgi:myo-inositol-1(or 4)-monophosphatase
MPSSSDFDNLRKAAIDFAELGGRTAHGYLGRVESTRKDDDSPVTIADHAAQAAILNAISIRFPHHAVLGEEQIGTTLHSSIETAEYCWIIDPIDGTRNFARGMDMYATSVALMREGRPVAGAIHQPGTGHTWSAAPGGGAWMNSTALRNLDRPLDRDSTISLSTVPQHRLSPAVRGWLERFVFRNVGSVCLHLVWVASGLIDAAYATHTKLWDFAAAALLIEEAGGVVTDHAGRALWPLQVSEYRNQSLPLLAGSPTMHRHLLEILQHESPSLR